MSLSANTQPHFTTIADFISRSSEEISQLFLQVLMISDSQGLIGREMFAIDGCKLDKAIRHILQKHRDSDAWVLSNLFLHI